jgi:hypothetical protein
MRTYIGPETPHLTDDQLALMRPGAAAQRGDRQAAEALTPLIKRLAANMENPMQQFTSEQLPPDPYTLAADAGAFGPPDIPDEPQPPTPGGPGPDDAFPICKACETAEYPPSSMQSKFCTECVNAMLHGLSNRFAAAAGAQRRIHDVDRNRSHDATLS